MATRDRKAQYRAYYIANHEKKLAYAAQYRARNKEKVYAEAKRWLAEHPEKRKEYIRVATIKTRYGINREQHKALYEIQGHMCAICSIPQDQVKQRFAVDHDHETSVVRGLLCLHCNSMLGQAKEKIEVLESAIAYLKRHKDG